MLKVKVCINYRFVFAIRIAISRKCKILQQTWSLDLGILRWLTMHKTNNIDLNKFDFFLYTFFIVRFDYIKINIYKHLFILYIFNTI